MSNLGSNCRTGCPTRNHRDWGACARDSNLHIGDVKPFSQQSLWDKELNAYTAARKQGIQPAGTKMPQIQQALDMSDKAGRAWDAGHGQSPLTGGQ